MESRGKQHLPQFHSKLSPIKCQSPGKVVVPRLNLQPALIGQDLLSSTESLRSAATSRMSLQSFREFPSFSSPRIVRASHDLTLPCLTSRDPQFRKLKARPKVVLIGRHRRPVCANLLIDKINLHCKDAIPCALILEFPSSPCQMTFCKYRKKEKDD